MTRIAAFGSLGPRCSLLRGQYYRGSLHSHFSAQPKHAFLTLFGLCILAAIHYLSISAETMLERHLTIGQIADLYRCELVDLYPRREIDTFIYMVCEDLMHMSRADVLLSGDEPVLEPYLNRMMDILSGLKQGRPIQHLLGKMVFYGLPLEVGPQVLIPRPETEELVHWLIQENAELDGSLMDICTGSGCIALAAKSHLPAARVSGVDNSVNALNTACRNARNNKLNIDFFHFDVLEQQSFGFVEYDVIVSNPPYVKQSEQGGIEPHVLNHEPHEALFVPDDEPLLFYRRIVDLADSHLSRGGALYFEINRDHGAELCQLLRDRGYMEVECRKDINKMDRMVRARKC